MRARVVRGANGEILAAIAEDPNPEVFAEAQSEDGQQSEIVETTSAVFTSPENLSEAFSTGS